MIIKIDIKIKDFQISERKSKPLRGKSTAK